MNLSLHGYEPRPAELSAVTAMLRSNGAIRAAILEGAPGCGKTALAQAVAASTGARLVYALLHSWSDDQELFSGVDVAAAVEGDAARVRQPGILAVAAEASRHGLTVLCLDEVDKVQERTENLLLDFLQTGRVPVRPGLHLEADRANMLVFLTSNGAREFSDALLRRVRRVRMQPLPAEMCVRLATERSGAPSGVVRCLWKVAVPVAQADGAVLSVQELTHLAGDVWHCATSAADVREYLGQWAARGSAGAELAKTADVAAAWGEVAASRRKGGGR